MSSVVRNRDQVTRLDYEFVRESVEAMSDLEIMAELGVSEGAVIAMRDDLGLLRKRRHGKITSKGIERAKEFVERMKARLREEGVNGEEARYFMAEMIGDRICDINLVENWSRLHNASRAIPIKHRGELREIADEYMDVLTQYR
jgi:hypothetical protein